MSDSDLAPPIDYGDFRRVDIRVGTIVAVEPYPEARRPAFKLQIDFGAAIGLKRSSAQITRHYAAETLVGRQVAAVVNFPPSRSASSCPRSSFSAFPTPPARSC